MKRIFSIAAVVALCSTASFAQYTNFLDNATNVTVNTSWTNDVLWVGHSTASNTLSVVSGGAVYSTNVYVGGTSTTTDNTVSVSGTGGLTVDDTLTIGSGVNNSVTVTNGGTISAGNLVINSGNAFNLDAGGIFSISTNFNASIEGFNWNDDGTLAVKDGDLTGIVGLGGANKTLVIDGGTWTNDSSPTYIGYNGTGNQLVITNGGLVTSSYGYIGYGLEVDTNYTGVVLDNGNVISNDT